MRRFSLVFILLFSSLSSFGDAASTKTLYYFGEARILNLISGESQTQTVLLAKTMSPSTSTLSELACIQQGKNPAEFSPVYMKVTGNTLKISDTLDTEHPNKLSGTGRVSGADWNWNYLKFSMLYSNGVKIEDVNFVVKDILIARKQMFLPSGSPFSLWEAEIKETDQESFQKHLSEMGCPTFGN